MRESGTVKLVKVGRYAFLKPDAGGADVFLHISEIERAGITHLKRFDRVTFARSPGQDGKGPRAVAVEKVCA